jgi:hypothetical protein
MGDDRPKLEVQAARIAELEEALKYADAIIRTLPGNGVHYMNILHYEAAKVRILAGKAMRSKKQKRPCRTPTAKGREAETLLISGLPDRTEEIHPTGNVVRYTHEAYKIFFAEVDRPVLVNNTWAP